MPQSAIRRYLRHGMLPQLAVFESAARLGSFTRAAEALHLAQPTVSTQVSQRFETINADIAFEVLLETGIRVQPLPVWEDEWQHPENYSNPRLLANIAKELTSGYVQITTRANLQMRLIQPKDCPEFLRRVQSIGLHTRGSGADNIRNLTMNPTAVHRTTPCTTP